MISTLPYILLFLLSFQTEQTELNLEPWAVTYVVDGDTFYAENKHNGRTKFRLIGIDCPESKHPSKPVEAYSKEAYDFLKSYIDAQEVLLEYDVQKTDRYNRSLVYVYTADTILLNQSLVEQGLARVSTFPPNVKYVDQFTQAQRKAREDNKGMWSRN